MSALAIPILACNRHLLIDLPIFMGPVVLLAGWLLVMTRRARRGEERGGTLARAATHEHHRATRERHDATGERREKLFGVHA